MIWRAVWVFLLIYIFFFWLFQEVISSKMWSDFKGSVVNLLHQFMEFIILFYFNKRSIMIWSTFSVIQSMYFRLYQNTPFTIAYPVQWTQKETLFYVSTFILCCQKTEIHFHSCEFNSLSTLDLIMGDDFQFRE